MLARAFIDRPVFAWVIALSIALAGLLSLMALPVEQYPTVAPPSLSVRVAYPGADANTLEQNVTSIIEQEMNGVDGFLYMASTSQSDGTAEITLTFESGTEIDLAEVEVQNRLRRVEARLPEEVRRQGILVDQANPGFLMIVGLKSPNGTKSQLELSHFATVRVMDELRRVPGVGDVQLFGSEYAMRIWLDPHKLAGFNLSPAEALAAVREQNSQTAAGEIAGLPALPGVEMTATVITPRRLRTPEQFEDIILRANPDGSTVRLRDVGRVALGAATQGFTARAGGKPITGMAVQLASGANALSTAQGVKDKLAEIAPSFPPDVEWVIPYDTSPFVAISVREIVKTLVEAVLLVFLVMFVFLQNLRATIIPTIIVPVALLGTCLGLLALGYSINVLSLFGMVLAIGILVDDAIVVIENVERIMKEEGLPPREATIKAVQQIIGAIIGITLVLTAVFVPMAFFPGTPGGIYRQFSVTLVLSMAFSALLALTLTPALCATILKPHSHEPHPGFIGRFFERFNNWFDRATRSYDGRVRQILRKPLRWMAIYAALVAAVALMFSNLPSSFLPDEDQGVLFTVVQLPAGATQERTIEVVAKAEKVFEAQPQVDNVFAAVGFSFFGSGQNMAMMFVALKPWDERPGIENHSTTVVANSMQQLAGIREGMIFALNPPAISELGNASGFNFRLRDSGGQGQEKLIMARNMLLGMAAQSPKLMGVRPEGQSEGPQLQVMIDRVKARTLGLQIADINNTLSISFGSAYANDFTRDGRVLRVILQADAPARMTPEDLLDLRVRNERGEMVPFSAFTTVKWTAGPQQLQRYNGVPSLTISGNAAPGVSTGEALAEMERLFQQLPPGFDYEWSGLSLEEKQSAGQVPALLALSMLIVFLVLAALYESWTIPLAVMLVVPLGLIGALLAAFGAGLSNDIYFNVGMITIIGLSAKNAILIVEFARDLEKEGKDVVEATIMAARLRLRPILMTSLAFILGVLPLVLSAGAGAASRNAVGTGVMGGMVSATFLAIFFVPVFFVLVRKLFPGKPPVPSEPTSPMTATPETKHEG